MGEGLGVKSFLGLAFQATPGVVQTGSVHWVRMLNNTIQEQIGTLEGMHLQGRYDSGLARHGQRTIAGDLEFEPDTHFLAAALHAVLGKTVTTSPANGKLHTITPVGSGFSATHALQPFAALCGFDVGTGFTFYNLCANQLTLTWAAGEFVKAKLSVIGGYTSHAAEYSTSYNVPPIAEGIDWSTVSLTLGAAAFNAFSQLEIVIDNKLEQRPTLEASPFPGRVKRNGFREVKFTGTVEFESLTEYAKWRAETTQAFNLFMIRSVGSDSANFTAQRMRYDAYPVTAPGPGPLTVAVAGRFEYHQLSAESFRAAVYTHSYLLGPTVGNGTAP